MKNKHRLLLLPMVFMPLALFFLFNGCKEKAELPSVQTGEATVFSDSRVVAFEGSVTDDGGAVVKERGICFVPGDGTPDFSYGSKSAGSGRGSFVCAVSGMKENSYSYRAYAINEAGTVFGETKTVSFTGGGSGGSGGGGGGASRLTINDFLGTYKCKAYAYSSNKYESWENVNIGTFTGSDNTTWIYVEGIYFGHDYLVALGKFDEQNQCLRLYSDWYFKNNHFVFNGSDTTYYGVFHPVYVTDSVFYWLYGGSEQDGCSEAWLTFNSEGKLIFGPSNSADDYNRYANGYTFKYYRVYDEEYCGYFSILTNVTFTKTGDGALPALRKSAVFAEKSVSLSRKNKNIPTGKKRFQERTVSVFSTLAAASATQVSN